MLISLLVGWLLSEVGFVDHFVLLFVWQFLSLNDKLVVYRFVGTQVGYSD